jgi:hypothetical protein
MKLQPRPSSKRTNRESTRSTDRTRCWKLGSSQPSEQQTWMVYVSRSTSTTILAKAIAAMSALLRHPQSVVRQPGRVRRTMRPWTTLLPRMRTQLLRARICRNCTLIKPSLQPGYSCRCFRVCITFAWFPIGRYTLFAFYHILTSLTFLGRGARR